MNKGFFDALDISAAFRYVQYQKVLIPYQLFGKFDVRHEMSERAPVPCPEMTDIRAQIDALDEKLVQLLAERQKLIEAAGQAKPRRDQVRDDARSEEVVGLVLETAKKEGLATEIAEPVWRQLIESSIAHEYRVFDKR
jgi:isochorismate pyruvate lyase